MLQNQSSVELETVSLKREMSHEGIPVLSISVSVPRIVRPVRPAAAKRINRYYRHACKVFLRYCETHLYKLAVEEFEGALANSFPFRKFDAVFTYTVTWNQDCVLSLYTDSYEYTGGAHGNTVRYADTWDLNTGYPLPIAAFFPHGAPWRKRLIAGAAKQAEAGIAAGEAMYFDDYKKLLVKHFNSQNFYLVSEGLAVYYQLYTVAPYVEGIVSFSMPFDEVEGPFHPRCPRESARENP